MNGLINDERGKTSSARLSWWVVLTFTLMLIAAEAVGWIAPVSAGAYTLLGTLATFTLVWTAGPRMASYLAPQIGKAVQAVGEASARIRERREQGKAHGEEPS